MNNDLNIDAKTLRPFRRFIYTIGELPTSYLMSMTYEEQLIWLCNYITQTVIPTINNNGKAVKELQDKFIELKNYIDDYFENLDVQEEINNKLDDMAESGQLQEIIAEYLNLITNLVFNNVNDMKEAVNLVNGNYVKTLGFYELGDGGSAYYHIRNVTNIDVIDEHFIIALNDPNLVAEFTQIEKDFHSKQVGLKGDDTTDETTILQKFLDYENYWNINKIIDEGIYLISDSINIKGRNEQDGQSGNTYQNGAYKIKFDNASIHCEDSSKTYLIKIYNFIDGIIDGLSITRSTPYQCKILISHCVRTEFKNFNTKCIELNTDPSLLSEELNSYETYHVRFNNGYIRGQVIIDPYNDSTHYINGVYFEYVNIHSFDYNSTIVLKKSFSKQQICFNNCDLTGSTQNVYDVDTEQINPYNSGAVGSCHIVAINCYYDSNVPLFKNRDHKNVVYSEFGTRHSGNITQNSNQKMGDFLTTTILGVSSHNVKDQLPITNLNLITNGDMTSHTYTKNDAAAFFGIEGTNIRKEYVASDYQKNGYIRQLIFKTTNSTYLTLDGQKFTYNAPAVAGLIFEVVSGGADIGIQIAGQTEHTIYKSDVKEGINIVTTNPSNYIYTQGNWSYIYLNFSNVEADTVINVYEIGLQMGSIYIPNAPLIKSAIPSS